MALPMCLTDFFFCRAMECSRPTTWPDITAKKPSGRSACWDRLQRETPSSGSLRWFSPETSEPSLAGFTSGSYLWDRSSSPHLRRHRLDGKSENQWEFSLEGPLTRNHGIRRARRGFLWTDVSVALNNNVNEKWVAAIKCKWMQVSVQPEQNRMATEAAIKLSPYCTVNANASPDLRTSGCDLSLSHACAELWRHCRTLIQTEARLSLVCVVFWDPSTPQTLLWLAKHCRITAL